MKNIAILGATGHIGKALSYKILSDKRFKAFLFARSKDKIKMFLDEYYKNNKSKNLDRKNPKTKKTVPNDNLNIGPIENFSKGDYDIIINCIGIGSPAVLKSNPAAIFEVTEVFDKLIMDYLKKNPNTLYINLSSGAVYGRNSGEPVTKDTKSEFHPNSITPADFYSIAKINSEAKHRARPDLNIVDLRVFSFFSRFIDPGAGFMLSELVDCLKNKKTFLTSSEDIIRDYVIADDLFSLIDCLISKYTKTHKENGAYDVYSKKPVSKFQLLRLLKNKFGLHYEIQSAKNGKESSPTGTKKGYYSKNKQASALGYEPKFTSLQGIEREIEKILSI